MEWLHIIGLPVLAQVGKHPVVSFVDETKKLIVSLAYLETLLARKKDVLITATAGPEGTVNHVSVQGFSETVKALEAHIQVFDVLEHQDAYLHLPMNQGKNMLC